MKCAPAILLVVALAGCQNATRQAFQKAAGEVITAEAEARALDIKWLPERVQQPGESKTAKLVLKQGMTEIKPRLRAALGQEYDLYGFIMSSESAKTQKGFEILDSIEPVLNTFVEVSKMRSFGYKPGPEKYYVGDKDLVSNDLKEAVKLLTCRAIALSMKGDTDGVVRDIEAALRLSRFPKQEGTIMGLLWSGALMQIVLRSIEYSFTFSNDPSLVHTMERLLTEHSKPEPLDQLLNNEPSLAYYALDSENIQQHVLDPLEDADTEIILVPSGIPMSIASKALWTRYLQSWCRMVSIARSADSPGQIIERIRADEERVSKLSDPSFGYLNTGVGIAAVAESMFSDVARVRCVLALSRALQHRNQHGTWPQTVSEVDPFNDRPLKFKFSGNTAVFYSIGRDLEDDGGKEPIEDVVARFPLGRK